MLDSDGLSSHLSWDLDAVDPARMKILALLLRDPNPIHFDPDAVGALGLPGLVNQGPSNLAMIYNLFAEHLPAYRVRQLSMRFRNYVLAGDSVRVEAQLDPAAEGPRYAVTVRTNGHTVALEGSAELELR